MDPPPPAQLDGGTTVFVPIRGPGPRGRPFESQWAGVGGFERERRADAVGEHAGGDVDSGGVEFPGHAGVYITYVLCVWCVCLRVCVGELGGLMVV